MMNAIRNRSITLTFLILFIMASCSNPSQYFYDEIPEKVDFPHDRSRPSEVIISPKKAKWFQLWDPQCLAKNTKHKMTDAWIHTNINGTLQKIRVDILPTRGSGLSNKAISMVVHGYHIQEIFSDCSQKAKDSFYCRSSRIEIINAGKPMNICQGGIFPESSLENIALNAVVGISQVYKMVEKVDPALVDRMERLVVWVQPRIEKVIEFQGRTLRSISTDNAFWMAKDGVRSIGLLPHSERYTKYLGAYKLFEQLSVIAHEYSHHIFYYLGPELIRTVHHLPRKKNPIGVAFEQDLERVIKKEPSSRKIDHELVIASINEGFADLLAYHALLAKDLPTKIFIGPHSELRDVGSSINTDGTKKVLSFEVLKHFFSSRKSYPQNQYTPNHQDIHTLGAIYAYSLNRYFQMGSKADPYGPVRMSLEWISQANDLARLQGVYPKSIFFLEDLFEEAIRLVSRRNRLYSRSLEACKVLAEQFPVFFNFWHLKADLPCS